MKTILITKYYYHYYLLFILFILLCSGTITFLFSNFSSTRNVEIYSFWISSVLYFGVLFYFFCLHQKQQWIIPHNWANFRKRPTFYSTLIFPIVFIGIFWMSFSSTFPMLYTALFGVQKTLVQKAEAQKKTYKGNITYCLYTVYSCLPIFKIESQQFQQYQNQDLTLKLTVQQSSMGTIIRSIHHIEVLPQKNSDK